MSQEKHRHFVGSIAKFLSPKEGETLFFPFSNNSVVENRQVKSGNGKFGMENTCSTKERTRVSSNGRVFPSELALLVALRGHIPLMPGRSIDASS